MEIQIPNKAAQSNIKTKITAMEKNESYIYGDTGLLQIMGK